MICQRALSGADRPAAAAVKDREASILR